MTTIIKKRNDEWTSAEDKKTAEVVLNHIAQGKTQLEAFEVLAVKLERTPGAIGFRWNSEIRKHYQDQIKKLRRDRIRKGLVTRVNASSVRPEPGIKSVIEETPNKIAVVDEINKASKEAAVTYDLELHNPIVRRPVASKNPMGPIGNLVDAVRDYANLEHDYNHLLERYNKLETAYIKLREGK